MQTPTLVESKLFISIIMAERLHLSSTMAYESMLAAEHLARYWLLKDACRGKRVLDVACGEGYGSSLLRTWGAVEVVGVDLSEDAIENARVRFGADGIFYRVGDACNLREILAGDEKFDLIACFETMEHVPDVPGLLRGIGDHLAPGGSIAISCPNDLEVNDGQPNEFHLKAYSFQEFQAVTTAILGAAVEWKLGSPILGFGVYNSTDQWISGVSAELSTMLDGADISTARLLPAQAGHEVSPLVASYYIGVWGEPLPRTVVAGPIAHRAYVGPWNSWMAARKENECLTEDIKKNSSVIQGLEYDLHACKRQIADERRARLQIAAKLSERVSQYQQATSELKSEHDAMKAQLHLLRSSRVHRMAQRYYHLYEKRSTRWFMRPLRSAAAVLRRWLSR